MEKFPIDKKFSYDNHVNNLLRENSNPSKSKFTLAKLKKKKTVSQKNPYQKTKSR